MIPLLLILACSPMQDRGVPVIYCTDLFHPHDDPDDRALDQTHQAGVRLILEILKQQTRR